MIKPKTIHFKDYPDFKPNLTPRQIFQKGSFGGTYWRPIYSSVVRKKLKNQHRKYSKWWKGIPESYLTSSVCDKTMNKYKVTAGSSLEFWESKKWISELHPYGWVQWYCDFYSGKRSKEDERQIKRWKGIAGKNGRFRKRLVNMIRGGKSTANDYSISPNIRQTLLHWAYEITDRDTKND